MIGKRKSHTFLQSIGFTALASALFIFGNADAASAHGYIESPKSRALLCSERVNTDCGGVIYEPQSLKRRRVFQERVFLMGKLLQRAESFHN